MTERQREAVSALLDGELSTPQVSGLLDTLERDADLSGVWERYHLIGGALRSEGVARAYRGIAAGVRERIATEPTVLAPAARPRQRPEHARPSRLAPFAGVALAASAAFLAVFAVPTLFQSGADQPRGPLSADAGRTASIAMPLAEPDLRPNAKAGTAAAQAFLVGRSGQRWHLDQPGVAHQLDRLLVNHQEYAPATGINGVSPYATLVSYVADR